MEKWTIVITIVQVVAVPVVAFLIRMVVGDARTENERIISDALRQVVTRVFDVNLRTHR